MLVLDDNSAPSAWLPHDCAGEHMTHLDNQNNVTEEQSPSTRSRLVLLARIHSIEKNRSRR